MKQIYGLASEVCKSSRVQCLVESSPHTGWWHPFRHRGWAASLRISRSARGRLIAGGFANTCAFEPLLVDIWTETSTLLAWKQAVNIGQRTGPCPCAKAGTVDCGMGALHQRPSLIATCAGFKHPFQAPEGQLFFFCHVSRLHHPDERLHRCRVLRLDKLLGARLRGCWQAAGLTALQRAGIITCLCKRVPYLDGISQRFERIAFAYYVELASLAHATAIFPALPAQAPPASWMLACPGFSKGDGAAVL